MTRSFGSGCVAFLLALATTYVRCLVAIPPLETNPANPTDSGTLPAGSCGNGLTDVGEACDGVDVGGFRCETLASGFAGGTLRCANDCSAFDVSGCTRSAVVTTPDCADTTVQRTIDGAPEGATVSLPPGNC